MAPIAEINVEDVEPMSRTYQYRKVMKPMLERKRRARMNRCVDDLKDLMVGALQHEGESITKLEKADVLELTVTHLKKLKRHNALSLPAASHTQEKFNSGFRQCTSEVTKFINTSPGIDIQISNRLLGHLGGCINSLDKFVSVTQSPIQSTNSTTNTPPTSPITVSIPSKMYTPPASPDNTRQQNTPVNQMTPSPSPSACKPLLQQSYNGRVPIQLTQSLMVPAPVINSTNVTNITYKIAANQHYQQQQIQQQQQVRYQQHTTPSSAPPTPPLSVGAPSPVHTIRPVQHQHQQQQQHYSKPTSVSPVQQHYSSPKPTSVSPGPLLFHLPAPIPDGPVWRPWQF